MIKISDTIRVIPGYRYDIPERHAPIPSDKFAVVQTIDELSELIRGYPMEHDDDCDCCDCCDCNECPF